MLNQILKQIHVRRVARELVDVSGIELLDFYKIHEPDILEQQIANCCRAREAREERMVETASKVANKVSTRLEAIAKITPLRWSLVAGRILGVPSQTECLLELAVINGMQRRHVSAETAEAPADEPRPPVKVRDEPETDAAEVA